MNMTKLRLAALSLLLVTVLAACNLPVTPTPLPEPTALPAPTQDASEPAAIGSACVVGTWQVSNLAEYVGAALPQMVEGAQISLGEMSGGLTYTFNPDGTTLGQANDFSIKATVEMNGLKLPGQIQVNGSSQGKYSVDEGQGLLTLTEITAGDLSVSANVAGIPVVQQTAVTELFMLGSGQDANGSTSFQCIGDAMQISVDVPNLGQQLVQLSRVR